jgi:nucleoside-diphosphate-sugar epimerase
MKRDMLLVLGACGQPGAELTLTLRKIYGPLRVVASDLGPANKSHRNEEPYEQLDVLDKQALSNIISRHNITQIYLFASKEIAESGQFSAEAWRFHTQGLLNVLALAAEKGITKVFWPSSIAVLGPDAPRQNCPQSAPANPVTPYGISKIAGELWCRYYWMRHGVDVRSLRYPGLISHKKRPGGEEVTDYVIDLFHSALKTQSYTCFLQENTILPMMYMPDAVRATVELMEAPAAAISVRGSYNINAMNFSPRELAQAIQRYIPEFSITYKPDFRQSMAQGWPVSVDDSVAAADWKWEYTYSIAETVRHMLAHLSTGLDLAPGNLKQLHSQIFF